MSDYPEHDKLSKISDQSQLCGEFLEWLRSQGIRLMTWREDLTDARLTDTKCKNRDPALPAGCSDIPEGTDERDLPVLSSWARHCAHWLDVTREQANPLRQQGTCCRCDHGRFYEVTGIRSWVEDGRSITALLAGFFEIDEGKIEAEKRQMLASLRAS